MNTDHVKIKKGLSAFCSLKIFCERGNVWWRSSTVCLTCRVILLLWIEMQHNIAEAGGLAGWEAFPPGDGNCMRLLHIQRICVNWEKIGLRILPSKNGTMFLFLYGVGGACTRRWIVLGGNAWWWHGGSENNLEGLMKLYNWEILRGYNSGWCWHANELQKYHKRNGVKLTSLQVQFVNKNKKKANRILCKSIAVKLLLYSLLPGISSTTMGPMMLRLLTGGATWFLSTIFS